MAWGGGLDPAGDRAPPHPRSRSAGARLQHTAPTHLRTRLAPQAAVDVTLAITLPAGADAWAWSAHEVEASYVVRARLLPAETDHGRINRRFATALAFIQVVADPPDDVATGRQRRRQRQRQRRALGDPPDPPTDDVGGDDPYGDEDCTDGQVFDWMCGNFDIILDHL